jgi:hypothetical protein
MSKYLLVSLTVFLGLTLSAQELYKLPPDFKNSSVSSFENLNGLKGEGGKSNHSGKGNAFSDLKPSESKVLLNINGSGRIQRMWFTLRDRSPEIMRSVRLRIYWDGDPKPAVDVPFGDFFGYGLSKVVKMETALFTSPEGRSFNCLIPMPFNKSAKVVITNEGQRYIAEVFYDIDFMLTEKPDTDALYFHAFWTRQKTSQLGSDFVFLPQVEGKGRFLGVNIGVNADKRYKGTWWGEGEVKLYIDGDTDFPTINGTGTEDYIGTGWGMGQFTGLYQGCTVADDSLMQYAFYRFHIPDIIGFKSNFRGSIQQIGGGMLDLVRNIVNKGVPLKPVTVAWLSGFRRLLDDPKDLFDKDYPYGWVNFYRIDDYSATTYFYLNKTSTGLNGLPDISMRADK